MPQPQEGWGTAPTLGPPICVTGFSGQPHIPPTCWDLRRGLASFPGISESPGQGLQLARDLV